MSENIQKIINLVAKTEATDELSSYWESRYSEIFEKNLFKLSEKTEEALLNSALDKPTTPFGDIVLVNHLDKNENLDEILLQTTTETALRFLDSCLDVINFSSSARFIVAQYRKIGIGLFDFKEYLETKKDTSEIHEIDYIGNLISNYCYRASETIAQEKGVCSNWHKINKHLRPKNFEIWINAQTQETKTALELSDEFNQETINQTELEILPRRNSNILLFSTDLDWQIWSDRDETSPVTEITPPPSNLNVEQPELNLPAFNPIPVAKNEIARPVQASQQGVSDLLDLNSNSNQQPKSEFLESEKNIETKAETTSEKKEFLPYSPENQTDQPSQYDSKSASPSSLPELVSKLASQVVLDKSQDLKADELEPQLENPSKKMIDPDNQPDLEVYEPTPSFSDMPAQPLRSPQIHEEIENDLFDDEEELEEKFQLGELVVVKSPNETQHFNKVYQIIDIIEHPLEHTKRYRLTGGHYSLDNRLWLEEELESVDLLSILEKLNHYPNLKINLFVVSIIFDDEHDKILVQNSNNSLFLPGGSVEIGQNLQEYLQSNLEQVYKLTAEVYPETEIVQEVLSEKEITLYIGFGGKAKTLAESSDLTWIDLQYHDKLEEVDKQMVKKFLDREEKIDQLVEKEMLEHHSAGEEEIEKKVEERLVQELAILPTEEEIQSRIAKEVDLRTNQAPILEGKVNELQEQNKQLELDKEELAKKIQEQEQKQQEIEAKLQDLTVSQKNMEEQKQREQETLQQIQTYQQEMQTKDQQIAELAARLNDLEKEKESLSSQNILDTQAELEQYQEEQKRQFEGKLEQMRSEMNKQKESEILELKKALQKANTQVAFVPTSSVNQPDFEGEKLKIRADLEAEYETKVQREVARRYKDYLDKNNIEAEIDKRASQKAEQIKVTNVAFKRQVSALQLMKKYQKS